ncbi:MAG: DUF616 domain-containing protein [Lachnospiraceae bacterium]|nr:DUF616 domain-containing protein [Lachnospiraceae bacterium]
MDKKSVQILNNLQNNLRKGSLSIEKFPIDDVLAMVKMEYDLWLTEKKNQLEEYMNAYALSLSLAVDKKDMEQIGSILGELEIDLHNASIEVLERAERLEKTKDCAVVNLFIKNASDAYNRYSSSSISGENVFEGKGVVYTVITGNYDQLLEPLEVDENLDYVCFTNNTELSSEVWDIRVIENIEELDQVRLARKHKILCYEYLKEYDYSIYVDGKIQVIGNLRKYIEKYSKGSPMLCFPHFVRSCVYEESYACIQYKKDDVTIIQKQMAEYNQEGYPINNGLIDSACLVRQHHDPMLQKVMTCWWNEVKYKSRRDQLSIGYACWKNNFSYDLSDLFIYRNEYICKRRDREKPY